MPRAKKSETIVDAAAHDVGGERNVVDRRAAADAAEIFGLCRPVADQRKLDARADRSAGIGGVAAAESRCGSADVAERGTAGDEGHEPAGRIAEAPAHGREPRILGLATERAGGIGGAAVDIGPVDIAFDAENRTVSLIVVTDRAADQDTPGGIPVGAPPAATTVHADVEPAPAAAPCSRAAACVVTSENDWAEHRTERAKGSVAGQQPGSLRIRSNLSGCLG